MNISIFWQINEKDYARRCIDDISSILSEPYEKLLRPSPSSPVPSSPLPVASVQVRNKIDRLRDLYELEAVLELSRQNPDMNYLLQLDLESSNLHAIAASIGVTL